MSRYRLLKYITYCIGFQQFPVINIFGCFKSYELLGLLLLSKYKWECRITLFVVSSFIFFVLSPIISFCISIFYQRPETFYSLYPETLGTIKYDSIIFPLLQTLLMITNYTVIVQIIHERKIYHFFDKIQRNLILIGTCIAGISLFNCFFIDVFEYIPHILHNKHHYVFRSSGFSIEPSSYVLYQTWIVLYTYFLKHLFNTRVWRIMLIINIASLLLTLSSSLVALLTIIILSIIMLRVKRNIQIKVLGIITVIIYLLIYLIFYSNYSEVLSYIFINKIESYFTISDHTLNSGAFRAYTTRIGFAMFQDYPLFGVGLGNSTFYMQNYDSQMGIINYGETLSAGITPLNLFACVFAEQGLLGGGSLIIMLLCIIHKVWKYRNKDKYGILFFIGCLFNISILMTCPTAYSLYLWLFMAIAVGYIKHSKIIKT